MEGRILDLGIVALQTAVIYLALIFGLRAMGRRTSGQLTIIDLVIIAVLGSAVETAMVHADVSLVAGLVSATTLLLTNRLLAVTVGRSRRFRRFMLGGPILLVHNGHIVERQLARAGMTRADLLEALRERGAENPEDVRYAVLELDGEVNVVERQSAVGSRQSDAAAGRQSEATGDAGQGAG